MTVLEPPQSTFEWLNFKQPAVRDLAFALASPPLLAHWPELLAPTPHIDLPDFTFWQQHYRNYLPRLQELDDNPSVLNQVLSDLPSTRLGIRFEALLSFWLKDQTGSWHEFELLAQNIQLKDHKRTIGEIDFLIKNKLSGEIEHWELSLKFYLGEGHLKPFEWRGLNDRDTFGRKIKHTVERQFNVNEIEYEGLGKLLIQKRRAVFKGRLFYPDTLLNSVATQTHLDWLHPAHLRGSWGYQLPDNVNWRRAARREWLTPEAQNRDDMRPRFLTHGLYLGYPLDLTDYSLTMIPIERMIRLPIRRIPYLTSLYKH
ncbi:DUF1853 family protein [Aquirhabdus parva]|uniref:DUF1853 family protein n=1 Tax=Aquirhabdus parva TaxID=2283318 RepID=A0A345P7T6_9GAMM|nr:DUF1853 family protein [Aquirhabdus parva]AXI03345.1 DUF1853 family protein [Aquirhabdus parva]